MLKRTDQEYPGIPVGPLGLIVMDSCDQLGEKVNNYLVKWRKETAAAHEDDPAFVGYSTDDFRLSASCPRFGSGEGKGVINETVRGKDIYILVDVTNFSKTYKICGQINHKSPDDHFQDLKRMIAAIENKANRVNVIMPFLYEGRQHKRSGRESLDCAMALQELMNLGVSNIITFDAHDPRVQNAIPTGGFDNMFCYYQFIKALLNRIPDLKIDKDHFMMISPDEGATQRAVYMSGVLGVNMGMFYKRRDYTRVVAGRNPIVAHEFLGTDVEGKDVFIVDDMISSGDSMLDVARELKARKANRIFLSSTFGLFTNGMDKFDKAYEEGLFTAILTTNLCYQTPELLARPYYINVDMTKYLAYAIDLLNHNGSLGSILDQVDRIKAVLEKYNNGTLTSED